MENRQILFKKTRGQFIQVLFFWLLLLAALAWMAGLFIPKKVVVQSGAEEIGYQQQEKVFWSDNIALSNGKAQTDERAFEGTHSIKLMPENAFGFGFRVHRLKGNERITLSVWRLAEEGNKDDGVIAAEITGKFWEGCKEAVEWKDGWERLKCTIDPPFSGLHHDMKIYCWNSGKKPIYFDNLEVIIERE